MRGGRTGLGILSAGAFAWLSAAVLTSAWTEALFCGTITTGFLTAAWGLRGEPRPALVAWGLGLAAAGNAMPFAVYGVGPDVVTALTLLGIAGLAVAAVAAGQGRAAVVRVALAAAVPGALAAVVVNDLAGASIWTAGNVLILAGTAWTAARWPTVSTDPRVVTA